ncbi:MAG: DUF177 domain-containing protein [Ruminococcus sp.]|nr:DUF177 domain-containing protein [Ruminococcus sp.]
MILHLRELFDIEGEYKDIDYLISPEEIGEYQSYVFTAPIKVHGRVQNRAGIVTLMFDTVTTLSLTCDRCLKEFERTVGPSFSHTLVRGLESDEYDYDEYVVCERDVLDLNELALADLVLSLPTKILCKEDCKGLCPVCGHDLNEGGCGCSDPSRGQQK